MASLERLLVSPYTALIVAIVLGALALSGRFSVALTRTLLVIAFLVSIISLRTQALPILIVYSLAIAGVLILLGHWFRPELIVAYSGILTPKKSLLFSPYGGGTIPKIQIGESGVFIVGEDNPLGNQLFPALRHSQFRVESINGSVKVSAQTADRNGKLIAEIIRNKWRVVPPPDTWDRNYSSDALEVKDPFGRIVLQVRVYPDRIQIQGIWWIDMGPPNGIRQLIVRYRPGETGAQFVISPKDAITTPPIFPIFAYPSKTHLGEFASPN
jgi:hypothetical protein